MSGSCARSRAVSMGFAVCGQIELFALCVYLQGKAGEKGRGEEGAAHAEGGEERMGMGWEFIRSHANWFTVKFNRFTVFKFVPVSLSSSPSVNLSLSFSPFLALLCSLAWPGGLNAATAAAALKTSGANP